MIRMHMHKAPQVTKPKEKGYAARRRPPMAKDFVRPARGMELVKFLELMNAEPNAGIIQAEVDSTGEKRRGNSHSLTIALEMAYPSSTRACKADTKCLLDVFKAYVTKDTLLAVLEQLSHVVERLFRSPNSDSSFRRDVLNAVLTQSWGTEELLNDVKKRKIFAINRFKKVRISHEAAVLVEKGMLHPQRLTEGKMLLAAAELKKVLGTKNPAHLVDMILLVLMCTGARLIEALNVSAFAPSPLGRKYGDDTYIQVTGVAKEGRLSRRKMLTQLRKKQKHSETCRRTWWASTTRSRSGSPCCSGSRLKRSAIWWPPFGRKSCDDTSGPRTSHLPTLRGSKGCPACTRHSLPAA